MAPRGWAALSSRKAWLDTQKEGYALARASNTLEGWYAKLFHSYFSTYHWSLQDNEEPDPSKDYGEPAPHDEGALSFKTEKVNARKDQIRNYFKNHFNAKASRTKREKFSIRASVAPSGCQSSLADGSDSGFGTDDMPEPRGKKPKTEKLINVYWDLHKDRLLPLYQEGSSSKRIRDWGLFVHDAWAKESSEVCRAVEDEQEKRHDAALKRWNTSGLQPLDIETQRRALDSLSSTLGQFLRNLRFSTGFVFTVVAGGPDLSRPGELSIVEFHEGSTRGDHPIDFGAFANELFTQTIRPEFAKFLRKVLSSDQGHLRALESEHMQSAEAVLPRGINSAWDQQGSGSPTATMDIDVGAAATMGTTATTGTAAPTGIALTTGTAAMTGVAATAGIPAMTRTAATTSATLGTTGISVTTGAAAAAAAMMGIAATTSSPVMTAATTSATLGTAEMTGISVTTGAAAAATMGIAATTGIPGMTGTATTTAAMTGTAVTTTATTGTAVMGQNTEVFQQQVPFSPSNGTAMSLDLTFMPPDSLSAFTPTHITHNNTSQFYHEPSVTDYVPPAPMSMISTLAVPPGTRTILNATAPGPKSTYKESWWAWWVSNQPGWQTRNGDGTLVRVQSGDASNIQVGGQAGIIEFMMVLAWWGSAIQSSGDLETAEKWVDAVVDMTWILGIQNING